MDSIIRLENVSKSYEMGMQTVHALREISVTIRRGEFVSIMGKSGSGKSTLVNMIGCLDVPTTGNIYLEENDIAHLDESDLAQIRGRLIGFIFQTFNLIPTLSVAENIALPMVFQSRSEEEIEEKVRTLTELVDIANRRTHKPSELSGGQRQRVAIARALANEPSVVLADEPTGNLDTTTGRQIIDFLAKLNEEHGVTIILVTHDEDLAGWAERTLTLADGRLTGEKNHTKRERARARENYMAQATK